MKLSDCDVCDLPTDECLCSASYTDLRKAKFLLKRTNRFLTNRVSNEELLQNERGELIRNIDEYFNDLPRQR